LRKEQLIAIIVIITNLLNLLYKFANLLNLLYKFAILLYKFAEFFGSLVLIYFQFFKTLILRKNEEIFQIFDLKMSFTTKLLNGYVLSDVAKVINLYLSPEYATFDQMCTFGLYEQILVYYLNNNTKYIDDFYYACNGGHLEIVNLMIKKGENNWNWGLRGACIGGHLEIVKLMIEKGANYWKHGLTDACKGGHFDSDNARSTRFAYDNARSRLEIVNLMIEKGANDWGSGLYNACYSGNLEIVKLMIKNGADNWNDGLYGACEGGHFCYNNHCACFTYDNAHSTRFAYDNARSTRLEIIKLMIEKGANNWNDGLCSACRNENLEIVKLMIEKGATHCNNCNKHEFKIHN
jgi:ankyrin repeat protein